MVKGFRYLSYEERLQGLSLKYLSNRRHEADMVQVFKCIKGIDKTNSGSMFTFSNTGKTRGISINCKNKNSEQGFVNTFLVRGLSIRGTICHLR